MKLKAGGHWMGDRLGRAYVALEVFAEAGSRAGNLS